jgi:RNA polymerase sigma-70 factor (ECF subfamily)
MIVAQVMPSSRAESVSLDSGSFRVFYDEALPRVYGYMLRRCGGSRSVAEDLTQETFLAAVRELQRGRTVESALPWVLGIARYKLVDYYRRSERWLPEQVLGEVEVDGVIEAPEVGDERAVEALAQLPAAQRAALVLRHLDGLSVPEVATTLARSVEAVESLLARGRVSFRRAYAEVSE